MCYVTPSEHPKLPSVEDVREGVIATRIAGHERILPGEIRRPSRGILRCQRLEWLLTGRRNRVSIDPEKARRYHEEGKNRAKKMSVPCAENSAPSKG